MIVDLVIQCRHLYCCGQDDLAVGRLYPPLASIRSISVKIAAKVMSEAYQEGSASTYPQPQDKEAFIRHQLYDYNYDNTPALPTLYQWPQDTQKPFNSV